MIPDEFRLMSDTEATARIRECKQRLGRDLLILGHHYQTDAVIELADERGDSLELARKAAQTKATLIVFAGVHFMAETADILTAPDQRVVLPDADAGCPMAEMASPGEVEDAWKQLSELIDVERELLPVTYVNSSAAVKAFCGRHGGTVCTSSNAKAVLEWARKQRSRLFFMPDRHLGGNITRAAGVTDEEILLWKPYQPNGGNAPEQVRKARVILWDGHCHVHTRFDVVQVAEARRTIPGAKVLVHLECCRDVVAASDGAGSTSWIIRQIEAAAPGAEFVIGTEISLVERLARQFPRLRIVPLTLSRCPNMYRNSVQDMAWVMSRPGEINVVRVPDEIRVPAREALERMLSVTAAQPSVGPKPAADGSVPSAACDLAGRACVPCKGGIPALTREVAQEFLHRAPGWVLADDGLSIHRRFTFKDFTAAMEFARRIGELAEREGHHPVITIGWGFCLVVFKTAKIKGLHENDFIMAAKVNALGAG
ncbi:MAG TPA: quinolinate synthase NadA [Candidatus Ozemobacteraceae bacterium]|nr:quinolinate synthase NadA [Candidatus Ozemobacteraceae bacterium]